MATQRVLLGNIKGPKGETGATGPTGPAGTISVGTVTKGKYGTPPQVTNSGSSTAAVFDFVIPEGAPGDTVAALDNLTLDEPRASTATLPIPAAGERGKVIFGKIIKFFNDIKGLATTSGNGLLRALSGNTSQWLRADGSWQTAQNNLTTTAAGYVLDARQGKALNDKVTAITDRLGSNTRVIDVYYGGTYTFNLSGQYSSIFFFGINSGYIQVLLIEGGEVIPLFNAGNASHLPTVSQSDKNMAITLRNGLNGVIIGTFKSYTYSPS